MTIDTIRERGPRPPMSPDDKALILAIVLVSVVGFLAWGGAAGVLWWSDMVAKVPIAIILFLAGIACCAGGIAAALETRDLWRITRPCARARRIREFPRARLIARKREGE